MGFRGVIYRSIVSNYNYDAQEEIELGLLSFSCTSSCHAYSKQQLKTHFSAEVSSDDSKYLQGIDLLKKKVPFLDCQSSEYIHTSNSTIRISI